MQRLRISRGAAATYEVPGGPSHKNFLPCRLMRAQQVEHPCCRLVGGPRAARAQDRLALADNLGFNKQFAERRVRRVRGRQCEHDFRVTRYMGSCVWQSSC